MNKTKDTVLLFSPKSTPGNLRHVGIPLSLLAVGTPVSKLGYKIKIVDGNVDDNPYQTAMPYLDKSICIGVTSMTGPQIKAALAFLKQVKENYPKLPVIWGGFHPTILPHQTLASPYADIAVKGMGETTFLQLVQAIDKQEKFDDILGIVYKQNGKIIENEDRPTEDINDFPSLDYELLDDVEKYIISTSYADRTIDYISSYGCPFNCGFCAEIKMHKRRWTGRSAERIFNDIKNLKEKYSINGLRIADNLFFTNERRLEEFCKFLVDNNMNIKWGNVNSRTTQLANFSSKMWLLLQKAGLSNVLIGAESGDQEVLEFLDKEASVEDTVKTKELCSKYGVSIFISLIIGLPHGDGKKLKQTLKRDFSVNLDFINKLQKVDQEHHIALFAYTPFPGSPLYEKSIKLGFPEPKSLDEWGNINLNTSNLPWIDKKYLRILDMLTNYVFIYGTTLHYYKDYKNPKFKFFHSMLRKAALFRLKNKFFLFPIDYYLFKFFTTDNFGKKIISFIKSNLIKN